MTTLPEIFCCEMQQHVTLSKQNVDGGIFPSLLFLPLGLKFQFKVNIYFFKQIPAHADSAANSGDKKSHVTLRHYHSSQL